jgi:hypothetical protein
VNRCRCTAWSSAAGAATVAVLTLPPAHWSWTCTRRCPRSGS